MSFPLSAEERERWKRFRSAMALNEYTPDIPPVMEWFDRLLLERDELAAKLLQEKEHHEFYRQKVSDYMGAELEWRAERDALKARSKETLATDDGLTMCRGLNPNDHVPEGDDD